jgi:proteasome assembly chaperone (PAC2) family protein
MGRLLVNRQLTPQRQVFQAQGCPGPEESHSEGQQSREDGEHHQRPPHKRMSAGVEVRSSRVRMIAEQVKSVNSFRFSGQTGGRRNILEVCGVPYPRTPGRRRMPAVTFHRELPANMPTMVMAFGGWIDAGEAATGALRHLVHHLAAPCLASMDPEEFFVLTLARPVVRRTADGPRQVQWPQSEFFVWQPSEGQPGLLLFCGMEPHLKWRTYAQWLLDVAERCGVQRIVSLGALLAGQPHTRPPRVTGRSTDPAWQALVEAWGMYRPSRYEGPTGISTVVLEAATRRGISHLALMGQAPHYLQGTENPAVIQALLAVVTRVLDLGLDVSELDEAVQRFRARCDQAVARDSSVQTHIRQLEQDYDATGGAAPHPPQADAPNSAQLIQEVEDFLREEREGGGGI